MNVDDLALPCLAQGTPSSPWQHPLSLLLESTGEGIFGIDLEGHCMFINRAGARMLGFEPGEVLGLNMHHLTHHSHSDGSHYPDTDCPIFNAFRQGLPCRIDSEVFWRRDHTSFPVEYSSYPILDGAHVRGAVITFVDITERKQAADALRQAHDGLELRVAERTQALSDALAQLRKLSAYSETVREEERNRIAREVHDELGSLLVAMKMDVNWLDKRLAEQQTRDSLAAQDMRERMRSKCQNMSRLIESAVNNVGHIINDLRPSILDHQGLWAALEWQAQEFAQSAELALNWCMEMDDAAEPDASKSMAVFRIFQEMLSNVGRHAQARNLSIRIAGSDGHLTVSVRDDGRGARPEAFDAPQAYGVMGMRERARHFGGRIEIRSAVGKGSLFELHMPLSDE